MEFETKVKLFVDGSPAEWIACAVVYLYDRDRLSKDDFLGMDITDQYGEATFRFHSDQFADVDERLGGALPELYVKVYGRDDELVLTTRARARRNVVPDLIRVAVDREAARRHGLL